MKVAFATQDLVHINAHLGWASRLVIYEVSARGYRWLETCEFPSYPMTPGYSDPLATKIAAIADCALVYVADIRDRAIGRLPQNQITPIQAISDLEKMTDALDRLCMVLQGTPPPWLHRAIQRDLTARRPAVNYAGTGREVLA
ncbi:NifB/NifX family molybdenum-iron cluster-binding protein [Trichothermofontia sp.]